MTIFETIETALKAKLAGVQLEASTPAGQPQQYMAVPVIFAAPEEEFKESQYPCFVVSMFDLRYAPERVYQEPIYAEKIGPEAETDLKKMNYCQPYDIYYQIAAMSVYNKHDRGLHLGLMKKLRHPDFLSIIENDIALDLTIRYDSYSAQDITGAKKLFKKVWTYVVEASINDVEYQTVKKVLTYDVQLDQKSGG